MLFDQEFDEVFEAGAIPEAADGKVKILKGAGWFSTRSPNLAEGVAFAVDLEVGDMPGVWISGGVNLEADDWSRVGGISGPYEKAELRPFGFQVSA
jgi:hypothetical protein